MESLQDWINERLDNLDLLLEDAIAATNENADIIAGAINTETESVNYTVTDEFAKIWENANNALIGQNDILSATDEACNTIISQVEALPTMDGLSAYLSGETLSIVNEIASVDNAVGSVESAIQETNSAIAQISTKIAEYNSSVLQAMASAQAAAEKAQQTANEAKQVATEAKNKNTQSPSTENNEKKYYIKVIDYTTGREVTGARNNGPYTYEEAKAIVDRQSQSGKYRYEIGRFARGGIISGGNGTLDAIARSLGEDHMVAAKDGERILTANQNKNFELLANGNMVDSAVDRLLAEGFVPITTELQNYFRDSDISLYSREFYVGDSNRVSIMDDIERGFSNIGNNIDVGDITFNLPNVTKKEEFVSWLKNDKQIENILEAVTIGKALGGNSYTKMKY